VQAYIAGNSTPAANLDLLDEVISCRSNMAALLGFDSYTAFRCHDQTLAECPAAPLGFLEGLSREIKPLADVEVAQLQQRKRKHTGQAGVLSGVSGVGREVG
jgi:Zn-dependent oligopeptidase